MRTATAAASSRTSSEDRVIARPVTGGVVLAVADGVGGISGGGRAADIVTRLIVESQAVAALTSRGCVALLVRADEIIARDRHAGETTALVVAISEGGALVGASAGDSGALVLAEDGSIDELTAAQHRKRRLGSGRAIPVPFARAHCTGTLLAATDGLLDYASSEAIVATLNRNDNLDRAAPALIDLARLRNGELPDDIALALADWRTSVP